MRFKQVKSEVRQFRGIGWRVVHGWRYGRGVDDVSWVSELEYCMSGQFPLRDAFWSVAESYPEETGRPVPLTIVAWHLAMTVKNCPLHSFSKQALKAYKEAQEAAIDEALPAPHGPTLAPTLQR